MIFCVILWTNSLFFMKRGEVCLEREQREQKLTPPVMFLLALLLMKYYAEFYRCLCEGGPLCVCERGDVYRPLVCLFGSVVCGLALCVCVCVCVCV